MFIYRTLYHPYKYSTYKNHSFSLPAGSGLLTALDKGNKELSEAPEALGTLQAIVVLKHPP